MDKKKKYLGIITSFASLKNGLLQMHEHLVNELSINFEKVFIINSQNLRFFPRLSRKIYLEDIENENIDVASLNIVANDSNLIIKEIGENYSVEEEIKVAYVKRLFNNIYYGSITWAEYQLTRGTRVSDKIGITENLTEEVEKAFNYFY